MPNKIDPKQAALAAIEGLTIGDVHQFFNERATPHEKQIADMVETSDEDFECDDYIVSEGDDNGAYVMGWRWVSFCGVEGFDKDEEEADA